MNQLLKIVFGFCLMLCATTLWAQNVTTESRQELHSMSPSRAGLTEWILEKGKVNNIKMAAIADKQGIAAPLQINEQFSTALSTDIYGSTYILFPYDENSYVLIMPIKSIEIGKQAYTESDLAYVNFFSTSKNKATGKTEQEVKQWVIELTKKAMQ